jgi:hypothetical protein
MCAGVALPYRSEQFMAVKSILCALSALLVVVAGPVTDPPAAAASPRCVNISPDATQCTTNGSTQIVTTPPRRAFDYGFPWLGWPGFVVAVR